jgi:hypothetical protein
VDTDGFSVAVFKDRLAVDAMGKVIVLTQADYEGLVALADKVNTLPESGGFRNTWKVKQERTSQPIERLLIATSASDIKQTSVQGFSKEKKELKEPVGDIKELPDSLFEFTGLVLEAREGWERGKEDKEWVSKVKDLLGDTV